MKSSSWKFVVFTRPGGRQRGGNVPKRRNAITIEAQSIRQKREPSIHGLGQRERASGDRHRTADEITDVEGRIAYRAFRIDQ